MMRLPRTSVALFSSLLAAPLAAQAPGANVVQAPTPILSAQLARSRPASFVLDAGDHRTSDLVDKAAQFLGRNILFCEQETAQCGPGGGTLRLQQRVEVDATGCEELLCSLLFVRGLALVPIDEARGVYEVLAMAGPRGRELQSRAPLRTVDDVLARPQLRMFVTTTLLLKNINANIATNALRPFLAVGGNANTASLTLGTAGSNNGLVLAGFQDQVAAVIRMIRNLDDGAAKEHAQGDERIAELERRIAALEARLGGDKDKKEAPK
jgi:type II secretory pathway component GspD/PulD (secretin)